MTGYKFGDLLLVPFPFTDQSTTKRRPLLSSAAQPTIEHSPTS
jgi:hypothetical protein